MGKTVSDEATGNRVLQTYKIARSHVKHSALSIIYETADEWQTDEFLALMAWIDGEPLNELTGVLPVFAEESLGQSDIDLVRNWLLTLCDALEVLHQNELIHGDVSPRNMIVSQGGIVLTDYDCVTRFDAPRTLAGTVEYSPHTHLDENIAKPSDDFFSLAASFFHVLFDREPFMYEGRRERGRGLNWEGIDGSDFGNLTDFLDKATHPNTELRVKSAEEARDLLQPPDPLSKKEKPPDFDGNENEKIVVRTDPEPVKGGVLQKNG